MTPWAARSPEGCRSLRRCHPSGTGSQWPCARLVQPCESHLRCSGLQTFQLRQPSASERHDTAAWIRELSALRVGSVDGRPPLASVAGRKRRQGLPTPNVHGSRVRRSLVPELQFTKGLFTSAFQQLSCLVLSCPASVCAFFLRAR